MPGVLHSSMPFGLLHVLVMTVLSWGSTGDLVLVPPALLPPAITGASTCEDVMDWLHTDNSSPMLLQAVNSHYLTMQQNFMMVMQRNASYMLENMYLLCLDQASVHEMEAAFGVRCVRVSGIESLREIWKLRVQVLACLLRGGRDVLMSDNDALWLTDPMPDLQKIQGDILIQRGRMPPQFADPVSGIAMCMGFALFRAGGRGMAGFLDEVERAFNKCGDDQVAVNMAATELQLKYDYDGARSDMRNTESTRVGRGVVTRLEGNFTIALLAHSKYTRNCVDSPISSETIIAHCFPRANRIQHMKDAGLWFVG